jgi:hypothetical protein
MKNIMLLVTMLCVANSNQANSSILNSIQVTDPFNISYNNPKAIKTIKEFYVLKYGSNSLSVNNSKLMKKYVSSKLLKKINSLTTNGDEPVLDYDPFINAQDFEGSIIKKTLTIVPLKNENAFRVTFMLVGNKEEKLTTIDLQLIKTPKGDYLIHNIINNVLFN